MKFLKENIGCILFIVVILGFTAGGFLSTFGEPWYIHYFLAPFSLGFAAVFVYAFYAMLAEL